ncbi:LysR family transcriptional regulator [Terrilactibacillus sp. S3-3]|nr:LysR family transcriptional regulator [Terrilactibacillus sp. S3-3]
MFDLQDLKILLAVADCGSITKAAQTLGYVQPNVTQRIRNIEKKLGYPLFDRTKHGVALKPTGKIFIHYAQNILQLSREAEHVMKSLAVPEGTLSIGSMETTAYSRLPLLLKQYTQRYPHVSVSLQTGTTNEMIQKVLNYEIDGAFVAGPVHHKQLIEKTVP